MRPHTHPAALAALLASCEDRDSVIAARSGVTQGHLHDLVARPKRKPGTSEDTRRRIAEALGFSTVAITCWCDRPEGVCRAAL